MSQTGDGVGPVPVGWAIPGVTGWNPPVQPAVEPRAQRPDRSGGRGRRGRGGPPGARSDAAELVLGAAGSAGSLRSVARRLRADLADLPEPGRGLGSATALAADLASVRDALMALEAVYLEALAVADAEDASALAGVGPAPVLLRDMCGVPIRQAHGDLAVARRLFTTPAERGGLPQVGAALRRGRDPDAVPGPGRPVLTAAQARVIEQACRRLSHRSAAMVADTLLAVADGLSVDTLLTVARQARQAGLDADQPDPVDPPGPPGPPGGATASDDAADDAAERLARWWERRNAELREQRSATLSRTIDGWGVLHAFLPPEDVAAWEAVLDSMSAPRPAADGCRDPRTATQRRADALGDAARLVLASGELRTSAGAAPQVLVTVDLADLVRAAGHEAVRACVAATTGGGSPAYVATVRRRLGLVPTGMIDFTVLSGARWVAVRQATGPQRPDGVPGSHALTRRMLQRLLRSADDDGRGASVGVGPSAGGPPAGVGPPTGGPSPGGSRPGSCRRHGGPPSVGPGHDPEAGFEIVHPKSLLDTTEPHPDDPVLGAEAVADALSQADPALVEALLRCVAPALGGLPLEVLAAGRSRRTATRTQVLAETVRDRGCTVPGCTAPARWCQSDHVVPWADGGRTDLANLGLRCGPHHRAKTADENARRRDGSSGRSS